MNCNANANFSVPNKPSLLIFQHFIRLKNFCSSQIKSQLNHEPLLQIARQFMFFSKSDFNHTERGQFSISKNYIQVPLVQCICMYYLSTICAQTMNAWMSLLCLLPKTRPNPTSFCVVAIFQTLRNTAEKNILLKLNSKLLLIFSNFMRYLVL